MTCYHYVGPRKLIGLVGASVRKHLQSEADVLSWINETGQKPNAAGEVIATFIIDTSGDLWIADRHSEHVACAKGGPVLSAGEMTFVVEKNRAEVGAVTNQSTGFCPDPKSWEAVANALQNLGLAHPDTWATAFCFRLCCACGAINLVKDDWFVCALCDAELPDVWNFPRI